MAKKVYCIVTNTGIGTNGSAFAIREDNDEDIFIPKSIVEYLELEDMDRLLGVIVKNERENSVPWLMRRAALVDDNGERIDMEDEEV